MKLLLISAAASPTNGTAGGAVQIEPQYRTKIKSYVTKHKIRPVTTKEKIVVGSRVPADVELESVPADWGPSLTKYRYVYSGDRVILVDPGSRTVVQEARFRAKRGPVRGSALPLHVSRLRALRSILSSRSANSAVSNALTSASLQKPYSNRRALPCGAPDERWRKMTRGKWST